jgi:hypothetical protein
VKGIFTYLVFKAQKARVILEMNPDLKNHVDAITSNPELFDFFIVIAGEGGLTLPGKP